MKATQALHDRGQSIWLDNISRGMLDDGQLQTYIDTYSVTGLTSNPSIYDNAVSTGEYDRDIENLRGGERSAEEVFFDLAIRDLQRAADLFAGIHRRTAGVDGWVSLEVSPLLAYDTARTVDAAVEMFARANRSNLFVKIPGTSEGLAAVEECVFAGVPVNVTLLFDAVQYAGAAEAYLRGIERRISAGLDPAVASVASVFISRWDTAIVDAVSDPLKNKLGLTIGRQVYRAYRDVMESPRFQTIQNSGARMQRLLWASTKTKDPAESDTLYVRGLVAPFTINTMPDATLAALFADGNIGTSLARDGGDSSVQIEHFTQEGVDTATLADKLQMDGATSFAKAWSSLLARIDAQLTIARGNL